MINVSMKSLGTHGRLANQLFQIQSLVGLAERHDWNVVFPEWAYEPYFENHIPHGEMQNKTLQEKHFHYHDWNIQGDVDVVGYLQSEKYFSNFRLVLKEDLLLKLKGIYRKLFQKETIAIHIRRGDYVTNKNYFHLPIEWYISALLTKFPTWKNMNVLFFSDDIAYCKTHFECMPNAFFSEGLSDIEDMALGSLCNHFILSNSSFSWWMAYLGEKENSKIIHSGELFAGDLAARNDSRDYWPERWTCYKKDRYNIDLTDTTFTIPVFYDHDDRRKNFDLSLHMLQRSFDTNFIVYEQGNSFFDYSSKWASYKQINSEVFHRTKMLNDMTIEAQTEYIVNWDCDIILPPMQVYLGVEALRNGSEMCFPYDGRFARMDRVTWFPVIASTKDIGSTAGSTFPGQEIDHNSVGGVVMWNKEAFIQGGMENENFVSFGPEDCERHDRFKKLGYQIDRIAGNLFHMDHFKGVNSTPKNPFFKANHREIDKIREMSRDELQAYVNTWPWRQPYTTKYYHEISEGSIRSAKLVMEAIPYFMDKKYEYYSVIDVGGGVGEWNNGNEHYVCVDYQVDKSQLLIHENQFVEMDLNKINRSQLSISNLDLCLCLEVAEHLPERSAENLVAFLCSLSNRVLFSAAIPNQGGTGHLNEQWQSYWAALFEKNGFGAAKKQPDIRNNPDVEMWYRQNIVLYERGAKGKVVDFVLPEYYIEITKGLKAR